MRSNHIRDMYMCNNPPCMPWIGHNNRQMFPNGAPPMPPQHHQRHPLPYHMMPPPGFHMGLNWQGPGPSRPRGRGYRRGRGNSHPSSNRQNRHFEESIKDLCCKCGDRLQNCDEPGIHLCDGGHHVQIHNDGVSGHKDDVSDDDGDIDVVKEEDLDTRLEKLLENLKDFVRNKYQSVTEALEEYVSGKIEEVTTLHRENTEEKESLEKMKKELEEKAQVLIKQEKDLKEKQRRLSKDQDAFKREMKKEREEVCRQWQQLRDEITRMEELHESQKGRVKLDVGGHVFTTSLLTLTRESDSMLAAMFSGRHELLKEEDGCVFIDRDGTHFRYVLNYLRDGGVNMDCLPRDRQLLRELKKEATYYQLHGLLQQIEKCLY